MLSSSRDLPDPGNSEHAGACSSNPVDPAATYALYCRRRKTGSRTWNAAVAAWWTANEPVTTRGFSSSGLTPRRSSPLCSCSPSGSQMCPRTSGRAGTYCRARKVVDACSSARGEDAATTLSVDNSAYDCDPSCVLVCRGRTTSRLRNGSVLHCLHSDLPDGGGSASWAPTGGGGRASSCMLDCIYHEPDR